jgi:predicted PurR-regulated permease PerM
VDLLRNLFGSLTSGIIRLAVTVGILVAVYLLIVKPVLKTTNDAIKTSNQPIQKSFGAGGLNNIGKTIESVNRQVQHQIRQSFDTAKRNGAHPQRLVHCIQRANGNVHRIQRCTVKF